MTTVSKVAIEQGFIELGRFSQYYRAMFCEDTSQAPTHAHGSDRHPASLALFKSEGK